MPGRGEEGGAGGAAVELLPDPKATQHQRVSPFVRYRIKIECQGDGAQGQESNGKNRDREGRENG